MEKIKVVAFTGLIGSGKTTCANYLVNRHGYFPTKFAEILKSMLYAAGVSQHYLEGDGREVPVEILCGKTARYAMQTLGTEWGRTLIGDDLWANMWKSKAILHLPVVVDDCRFVGEVNAVHDLSGAVIRVKRPGTFIGEHKSESDQDAVVPDFEIDNSSDVMNLFSKLDEILRVKA